MDVAPCGADNSNNSMPFSSLPVAFSRRQDSFYYCFISLTTIGLGDFIPGDEVMLMRRMMRMIWMMFSKQNARKSTRCVIVMVTFDFLIQLYLLPELKRNRKKGYGRIVAFPIALISLRSNTELPAHFHSAPNLQNVKLQVWNNQTFATTQSHSTIDYHRSHSGLYRPIMK